MTIQITEQDDEPRILDSGGLVYSEKSGTLFIRTKRNGIQPIGASSSIPEADPVFSSWLLTSPNISIFTNDAGYLTSFSEADPIFNAWLLATPPLYSYTETDPVYTASSWYTTTNNASNWDTAYGWGNHASAGYLTSITGLMVTSALGYTPYNSTNPSGFITSASLSSYMLLSGGTFTGAIIEQPVTLTDAATIAVNATLGNIFDVTLGGNRILGNPTGAVDGQKLIFRVAQDGSGNRTLSFDTKYANTVYVTALSTGASKIDHIGVIYKSSTDKFYIVAFTPQNP